MLHRLKVSNSFILKYSNFNNKYWKGISSRFLNKFLKCFFGLFCQQCITYFEEMRNEGQSHVCPQLVLITVTNLLYIE